uniref:SWIM-type domain-containing protein n=1 Tax=Clytia hemisphaerica TaxID=252671 RepID=A0A7M5XKY7_9CNID
EIKFASCACVAGKAGTCSHSYALMKTILKWVIDRRTIIPEEKACTSQRCAWNQVQMRKHEENINRMPLSELTFKSPPCLKRKRSVNKDDKEEPGPSKESKGITSSLYESRKHPAACPPNLAVLSNLLGGIIDIPGPKLINASPEYYRKTTFGDAPSGSMLSYQCPLMPPNFKVYCSIEHEPVDCEPNFYYPTFPFKEINNKMASYEEDIHIIEIKKITLLENLKISARESESIEEDTREQASNPKWFEYRKNRFTASLCNRLTGRNAPKTPRGLTTLAKNFVHPKEVNKIVKLKMDYGKFYEPIVQDIMKLI